MNDVRLQRSNECIRYGGELRKKRRRKQGDDEQDEIEDDEGRCPDCGSTEAGNCFYCKMGLKGARMGEMVNTWDQLKAATASGFDKAKLAAISYHAPDRSNSRDVSVPHWQVWSPFFQTDSDAAWYDNYCKTFSLPMNNAKHHERKKTALTAAMNWANEKYGPYNWARNRQGDYVPKQVNDSFPLRKRDK